MTSAGLRDLGRDLERLFREGSLAGASDARLLERFVSGGEAPAFEALVARYRDMLLRTCHDLLRDTADAEEAFQATVVILWRRAGSIREKDAIGGWLHRVACRVARRTRAEAARHRAGEGRAVAMRAQASIPRPDPDPLVRDELRMALHDEIDRLPDRYRRPVIICLLEGMSQEQAAARLGWTEGSLRGRLARGKARLRDRLTRRGIALAAVLAELAEPGPAAAAARPFLAILRTKAAVVALSALLAMGGATLAIAMRVDGPREPTAGAASAQPAPPPKAEPEPELEALPSFRGGGPTDQSRATALPPEIAARPVEFRGRVLDPAGKGVAGARLSLVTDAWSLPEPQTVSGTDGSFRFEKTVGDFWRNFATGGSATPLVQAVVLATHDSFGAAWVNLRVVAKDGKPALGGEYPLSLRMVADRPIEGRLLDDQGRPVAGAVVRVEKLYAVPAGDLSPIIDALRRLDLNPYQRSYPRIGPNHFEASMVIPSATTGADGRFTLRGVGRDRQANLAATGPGMAPMRWTVLNRDEAAEVTKAVRARWPHTPSPDGPTAGKAAPDRNPGVQVYGPTFDLRVDTAGTIHGVVRDAMTGRPVQGAMVFIAYDGSSATSDDRGHYRIVRRDGSNRLRLVARPPDGAPLLGAAHEYDRMPASGEVAADFALPRAVVVSGRAVERGTGRPMLATRNEGCHGPGPVMGGRIWYRPLAGNASVTGNEAEGYFRYGLDPRGLFVGLVEGDGVFRGVVPPGRGVLLLEASPGMPFMWQFSLPWKESDGYHRRFPYAPLTRREPDDGAPRLPGEAGDTLPGAIGPIALRDMVAYRVIEPAANDVPYKVEITIPTAPTRRVRFVDPEGRPVRGALVFGLTASPFHQVALDDDEAEAVALDPTRERRLSALSPDGRLSVETTIRGDSAEPVTVRMKRPATLTGRLVDEAGKAVARASASVMYDLENPPPIPLPRTPIETDTEGRFRVDGIFPGHPVTIEFHRVGKELGKSEHYRPESLRKLVLDDKRPRHAGTVTAKSSPW
jgi:RNA polymerase sigma factor (sigma-70 family)